MNNTITTALPPNNLWGWRRWETDTEHYVTLSRNVGETIETVSFVVPSNIEGFEFYRQARLERKPFESVVEFFKGLDGVVFHDKPFEEYDWYKEKQKTHWETNNTWRKEEWGDKPNGRAYGKITLYPYEVLGEPAPGEDPGDEELPIKFGASPIGENYG